MIRPAQGGFEVRAVGGIPLVRPGDDLVRLLGDALAGPGLLADGDILVVAQKIVSKAEGRLRRLDTVTPSAEAVELAQVVGKDARLVELVLAESRRVVRAVRNTLIVEHRLGHIMANAGIDQSNVGPAEEAVALLLPEDPDASCRALRDGLGERLGADIAVLMNDSFGRPWRNGVTGVCIGAAGLRVLRDRRGDPDLFGRTLLVTQIALGDEIAAAASLLMGQADEGIPAAVIRGLRFDRTDQAAAALLRPAHEDLFR